MNILSRLKSGISSGKSLRVLLNPFLILFSGFLVHYFLTQPKPMRQPGGVERISQPPVASVIKLNPKPMQLRIKSQGAVRAIHEVDLSSKVSGTINYISPKFSDGSHFREEEELAKIDDIEYQYLLLDSEMAFADARQLFFIEQGRRRESEKQWTDLGDSEANALFLREPQLAYLEKKVASAKAGIGLAQHNVYNTIVRAPFNGQIVERFVGLGQYVTPGTPIARLLGTELVEVRLPLTEKQLALIDLPHPSQTRRTSTSSVNISTEIAGQYTSWEGKLSRMEARIDETTRLQKVIIEVTNDVNNADAWLLPGLFVDAEILGKTIQNVVSIPRSSVFENNKVLSLDKDNTILTKPINILLVENNTIYALGNFIDGERIIIERNLQHVEGNAVKPIFHPPEKSE